MTGLSDEGTDGPLVFPGKIMENFALTGATQEIPYSNLEPQGL